jgi:hypothetical protein
MSSRRKPAGAKLLMRDEAQRIGAKYAKLGLDLVFAVSK